MESIANEPFLTNNFGDKYLYSVNHNTLNKVGAHESHRLKLTSLCQTKDTLFIVIGSDSGTLLTFLNAQDISTGTLFIIIEPVEIYKKLCDEYTFDKSNSKVLFISEEKTNNTLKTINFKSYVFINKIQLVKSLAADYAFKQIYHELFFRTQAKFDQDIWAIQSSLGIQPFIETKLKNLAENHSSSIILKNNFKNQTAVILAGGPSLDEILPWVIENKNSLIIFAVSRICRRLKEIDFYPDIIVSIDPHKISFDVSKEMLFFHEKSLFLNHAHVSPLLLSQWQGRNIYLGDRFPWRTTLNSSTLNSAGPTVANTAITAAAQMGFSQIVLAGVDLCHSKDGYTHAQGSNESKAGPQLSKVCTQVMTNGGWLAETTSDFASAIDILASQSKNAANYTTLINPAKGAARVDNVRHIDLVDIEIEFIPDSQRAVLATAGKSFDKSQKTTDIKAVLSELKLAEGELHSILKLTKDALRCNEGLFGKKGKKQDFKYKKRMDKIEVKLNNSHPIFSNFVKQYGLKDFIKITRVDGTEDWEDQELEHLTETYYKAYKKNAIKLIKLIRATKERIQSRSNEISDQPHVEQLISQWNKDQTPGRVNIFTHNHSNNLTALTQFTPTSVKDLLEQFDRMMSNNFENEHIKRSKKYAELGGALKAKIQMYYQRKDIDTLEHFVASLSNHHDQENSKKFIYLTNGYIHELKGEFNSALETYQLMFEEQDEIFIEDALMRISSISLQNKDIENALLALENLAYLSPSHLIKFADLLRLTGQHEKALNTYLDYIEQVPNDINSLFKTGQYYQKLGIEEGAEAMWRQVLQLDPANKAAKKLLASL